MREILERDGGSIRGDDDFFSVARTIPLVAKCESDVSYYSIATIDVNTMLGTFDAKGSHALVYSVQGIF